MFTLIHLSQGWLGGWLLPQEKSYFAIRLPQVCGVVDGVVAEWVAVRLLHVTTFSYRQSGRPKAGGPSPLTWPMGVDFMFTLIYNT